MEKINPTTKQADQIRAAHRWAMKRDMFTIWDAYNRPSEAKIGAYNYCRRLCQEHNGYNFRIARKSCMFFSVTFEFVDDNGVVNIAWITKEHDRYTEALEV